MFPCCLDEEEEKPSIMSKKTDHSLHANMLRESKDDVFKKFQVSEVLGQGSMGSVCKVVSYGRFESTLSIRSCSFQSHSKTRPFSGSLCRYELRGERSAALPIKPRNGASFHAANRKKSGTRSSRSRIMTTTMLSSRFNWIAFRRCSFRSFKMK